MDFDDIFDKYTIAQTAFDQAIDDDADQDFIDELESAVMDLRDELDDIEDRATADYCERHCCD